MTLFFVKRIANFLKAFTKIISNYCEYHSFVLVRLFFIIIISFVKLRASFQVFVNFVDFVNCLTFQVTFCLHFNFQSRLKRANILVVYTHMVLGLYDQFWLRPLAWALSLNTT